MIAQDAGSYHIDSQHSARWATTLCFLSSTLRRPDIHQKISESLLSYVGSKPVRVIEHPRLSNSDYIILQESPHFNTICAYTRIDQASFGAFFRSDPEGAEKPLCGIRKQGRIFCQKLRNHVARVFDTSDLWNAHQGLIFCANFKIMYCVYAYIWCII